jgi:hypothetical protein
LSGYSLNNLCLAGAVQGDPYGTLLLNGTQITSTNLFTPWEGLAPIGIPLPAGDLNPGANTLSYQLSSGWDGYEGMRLQGTILTCGASLGALKLTSATPASGSTGVSTNSTVTLNFNNPLDPATVSSTTLPVTIAGNTNETMAGSYQVSGNQVIFTSDSPFPVSTQIYVYACNGPYDTAGNSAGSCYTQLAYFTTASTAAPVTPPLAPFQVIAFTPAANATNVGLRTPVVATFNRSFNPSTVVRLLLEVAGQLDAAIQLRRHAGQRHHDGDAERQPSRLVRQCAGQLQQPVHHLAIRFGQRRLGNHRAARQWQQRNQRQRAHHALRQLAHQPLQRQCRHSGRPEQRRHFRHGAGAG